MVQNKLKNDEKVQIHNVKTLRQKMMSIQAEIGFTDDEVSVIIFTSLDIDWFTNLIVLPGEFTKWFNINFEGEGRDEIDFRDNKCEIWLATVDYAKVILNSYAQIVDER